VSPRVLFYGCWGDRPGHFLHASTGQRVDERSVPWRSLYLVPGARDGEMTPRHEQDEGRAELHHLDGWTAVGWWDRSGDRRHGSVAVFFVRGTIGAASALSAARAAFPHVFARMTYPINVLVRGAAVDDYAVACAMCGTVGRAGRVGRWTCAPPGWLKRGDEYACSLGCAGGDER